MVWAAVGAALSMLQAGLHGFSWEGLVTARFLVGDVHERLIELPDDSVDVVMTSPPFLTLRSYLPADHPDKDKEIGSEPDPGTFVDVLCGLVDELARVLAPHGSMVFELGDTYSGSGGAGGDYNDGGLREGQQKFSGSAAKRRANGVGDECRPSRAGRNDTWPRAKSMALVPELFRIALAYGINPLTGRVWWEGNDRWMVRNVVRWVRPNPPVGALGDKFRPATSDLVVFTRNPKRYFDLDAVRSASATDDSRRGEGPQQYDPNGQPARQTLRISNPAGAPPLDWWDVLVQRIDTEVLRSYDRGIHQTGSLFPEAVKGNETAETPGQKLVRSLVAVGVLDDGDTIRLSPKGYQGSHYATFHKQL